MLESIELSCLRSSSYAPAISTSAVKAGHGQAKTVVVGAANAAKPRQGHNFSYKIERPVANQMIWAIFKVIIFFLMHLFQGMVVPNLLDVVSPVDIFETMPSTESPAQGFGDSASFEANDTVCFNIWANSSFDDDIIAALDEQQGFLHFPGKKEEVKSTGEDASWSEERSHFLKNMMGVCFARFYSIFDVFDIQPGEEHVLVLDWGDVNSLASAAALSSDSIWESLVSTEERLKHQNCPASPTSEPIAPKRQHFSLNENDEIDERRDVQFAKSVLDADSPKNRTKDFPVYSVSSSPTSNTFKSGVDHPFFTANILTLQTMILEVLWLVLL